MAPSFPIHNNYFYYNTILEILPRIFQNLFSFQNSNQNLPQKAKIFVFLPVFTLSPEDFPKALPERKNCDRISGETGSKTSQYKKLGKTTYLSIQTVYAVCFVDAFVYGGSIGKSYFFAFGNDSERKKMEKTKVIIDCDPGIDDSLAIMLALKSKELDVIGITIVCGNSPVEMGFENAKKILKQMNRLDVPVFIGEDRPLCRAYVNALDTHGEDGLGESFLPKVDGYEQEMSAVDFLALTLKRKKVSVIALGPMTNLARLIQKDLDAFCNIDKLVSMGGTFKSHGNCSPVAEYNYWCDPDAAALVYKTLHENSMRIHMIGLDVTRKIVLTPTILEYICRLNPKMGDFIKKITKFYFDFHWQWEHIIGCVINDPLAVAYFIDQSICSGFDSFVEIETQGISLGQSVVDSMNFYRKEPNATVLTEVDTFQFFQMFLSRLLDLEPEKLDILKDIL